MAGLETHELIPNDFQIDLIDPVLNKLESTWVASDEWMGNILNLLNNDSSNFWLSDDENELISRIIRRLESIKNDTTSHPNILESNFYDILDDFKPIHDKVVSQIFQDIQDIELPDGSIPSSERTESPRTTTEAAPIPHNSWRGVISTLTWWAFEAQQWVATSTETTTEPVIETAVSDSAEESAEVVEVSDDDITALENFKLYLESIKDNYSGENFSLIENNMIPFIGSTANMIREVVSNPYLLNAMDEEWKKYIQEFLEKAIAQIKSFAIQIQEDTLFNDYEWLLRVDIEELRGEHENVIQEARDDRNALREQAEREWINIENLTSYERAIYEETWLLPQRLGNVSGWEWDDAVFSNDYSNTARRMDEIGNPNSSLQKIIGIGIEAWEASITSSISPKVEESDIRNYLREIDHDTISDDSINYAISNSLKSLIWDFRKKADFFLTELQKITPEDNWQMPEWATKTLIWNWKTHTFESFEDKARFISTMLVILEAAIEDTDHWIPFLLEIIHTIISIPGKITTTISDFINLEWVLWLIAPILKYGVWYGIFSSPPAYWLGAKILWKNREEYDRYLREWTTPDSNKGKEILETLRERKSIIDALILNEKSKSNPNQNLIIQLKDFKDSWNILLPNWMFRKELLSITKANWSKILRILQLNYRWWLDTWRAALSKPWTERWIMALYWVDTNNIRNFQELLLETSKLSFTVDEAKKIYNNALSIVENDGTLSRNTKNKRKKLLKDYFEGIDKNDPIFKNRFLYIIDMIRKYGGDLDALDTYKTTPIPESFKVAEAISIYQNTESAEENFSSKKAKLESDISDINDTRIKDKLLKKLTDIIDADKLTKFEKEIAWPVIDLLNDSERFQDDIRIAIADEVYRALWRESDKVEKISEIKSEVLEIKSMKTNIDRLDTDIRETFYKSIQAWLQSDDEGKTIKKLNEISWDALSVFQKVSLVEDDQIKQAILEDYKACITSADVKTANEIKEWLTYLAKIRSRIQNPPTGMTSEFIQWVRNSLNQAHTIDGTDWDAIKDLSSSINEEVIRLQEVSKAAAAAEASARAMNPWWYPSSQTPASEPTTPEETTPRPSESAETVRGETWREVMYTNDGSLRASYQERLNRILLVIEDRVTSEEYSKIRQEIESIKDSWAIFTTPDEFDTELRRISWLENERLPSIERSKARFYSRQAEEYIVRIRIEALLHWDSGFTIEWVRTTEITSASKLETFRTSIELPDGVESIDDIRTLPGLLDSLDPGRLTEEQTTELWRIRDAIRDAGGRMDNLSSRTRLRFLETLERIGKAV